MLKFGRSPALTVAVVLAGCGIRFGQAQVLADRMPADAVVYASWAGSDALGSAYDASHFRGLLDALDLPQFIAARIREALDQQTDPQQQQAAKLGQDVLTTLAKSPTAIYLGPIDAAHPQAVHFALIARTGNVAAAALAAKINGAIRTVNNGAAGGPPLSAKPVGDYLLFEMGDTGIEKALSTAPADSLASTAKFKQATGQVHSTNPAILVYADAEALLKTGSDWAVTAPNAQIRRLWPIVAEGAGINSLKQMAVSGDFDGANWSAQSFIGLAEQRPGLMAFLDNPSLPEETFKRIPKSATWATVLRFDGMRLLADARVVAGRVSPQGEATMDTLLQQAFAWTGVDIKNDLLPSLSDQFIVYAAPDATGKSLNNITLLNKLKNEEKAMAALTAAESLVNLMAAQRDPNTKMQFKTEPLPAPLNKVSAHILPLGTVSPAWAIDNGVLYICLSSAGLQSAIQTANAKNGSILDNPQFAELRRKLAHDSVASFSFLDLPQTAPETYEIISSILADQQAQIPNAPFRYTLPPLNRIMPHLGPSLNISWSDTQGYHVRESGPFPYSQTLDPAQLLTLKLEALIAGQRMGGRGAQPARPVPNGLP